MLILSLFPGIGLLDMAFEAEGFCVVRGPDILWGGDIHNFHPPRGSFTGIIGGPPCQDFSKARRGIPPTGKGEEMLREYARVVAETKPLWWLLENVPGVPNVSIPGYITQRFDLNALECGSNQSRLRHFQFGSPTGITLSPIRQHPPASSQMQACVTATEGKRTGRRAWADFCEAQGLAKSFTLPGFTIEESYRAVGNGVPIPMGRTIAQSIKAATCDSSRNHASAALAHTCESPEEHTCDLTIVASRLCACGCGRPLTGRSDQKCATPGCRKRLEYSRKRPGKVIYA